MDSHADAAAIPAALDAVQTPAVVIDMALVRANIRRFQDFADSIGLKVRPHIKTHKLPEIARLQLAAGAVGITCQKVSEAEAMVAADPALDDILITYNLLGETRLAHLRALAERVKLGVVADSEAVVDGLSRAFADAPEPLRVLIECETGAQRCGVLTPADAAHLAGRIANAPGLRFGGLMSYPPPNGEAAVQAFMTEAIGLIEAEGLSVETVSTGGTPSMMHADKAPVATEYRPGTYVYNDRSLVEGGSCGWEDCALTVLATVVSVPEPNRAIIDAGSKTLTSDMRGMKGHGHVLGHPEIRIDQLSEEHGRLVGDSPLGLKVGDRVRIVPNHACVVSNMFDQVHLLEDGAVRATDVVARGRVV